MTSTQSNTKNPSRRKGTGQTKIPAVPQGTFVWYELRTPNARAAIAFFSEVVGWRTEEMSLGGDKTTLFANGEGTVAHLTPTVTPNAGSASFVSYVAVDDVDAAARRVVAAGGTIEGTPFDLPTIGRMVEARTPDGAAFFLYRSANEADAGPKGPGGFIWNELWSKEPKKAVAFLTSLLGYSVQDMPMGEHVYHVMGRGEASLAGVTSPPEPSASPAWVPYLHVTDVDAARARALRLGATGLGEALDVEGIGRMAILREPQGALFAVMTPAR